jgi:hypothetical protein
MSIFLVGGGPDTTTSPVIFDQFVADVVRRTGEAGRRGSPWS